MINFEFFTPTKVYFGKDTHLNTGEIIKEYGFKKVLIHYGGSSAKKSGLLDIVVDGLKKEGIETVLFGGVQPNPTLGLAKEGIKICQDEGVDLILAVGGGSVLDSAKCIADGVGNPEVDVWKYYLKEAVPKKALPIGTILTLAASGSEMSGSSVITNEEGGLKRGFNSVTHRPLFSILNPELTYSVNEYQSACGIVDIMMHTLERYFTKTADVDLTDRLAEGLLKSVIEAGKKVMNNPKDYEARATLMWAGSLSHNDLTGAGREVFMSVHQIEHEISGMYPDVAHGAGLSTIFSSWARYVCKYDLERFVQYAVRVWNCEMNFQSPMETALAGIKATEDFFKEIKMPISLKELNVSPATFEEMADKCTFFGKRVLPDYIELDKKEIVDILTMAYEQ